MKFLVVGCGSIGQRHIRNLKMLRNNVKGCEKDIHRARKVSKKYGIEVFEDINDALEEEYNGVFVCVPTSLHVSIALKAVGRGMNLFIEKPLSNSLTGVNKLIDVVREKNLITLVGCNMRFLPSVKLMKSLIERKKIGRVLSVMVECGFYLPYWHPGEDYRKEYSANKRLGGGVIFDDIHEVDTLSWFFGHVEHVFCYADKISGLSINTEDIAEIILKFKSGVIAQIHLDYLQRTYRRNYKIIGDKGMIEWDYIKQDIRLYSEKTNCWTVLQESINTNREEMFIDEVRHFTSCIRGKEKCINNIGSAKETLKIALACYESSAKKKVINL